MASESKSNVKAKDGTVFVASILFLSDVNKILSEITAVHGDRLCNDYVLK